MKNEKKKFGFPGGQKGKGLWFNTCRLLRSLILYPLSWMEIITLGSALYNFKITLGLLVLLGYYLEASCLHFTYQI